MRKVDVEGDGSAEDDGAAAAPHSGCGAAVAAIGGCGCGSAAAISGAAVQDAEEIWHDPFSRSAPAGATSAAGSSEAAQAPGTAREAFVSEDGGDSQAAGACGAADAAHGAAATPTDSARATASYYTRATTSGWASEGAASAGANACAEIIAASDNLVSFIMAGIAPRVAVPVFTEYGERQSRVGGDAATQDDEIAKRASPQSVAGPKDASRTSNAGAGGASVLWDARAII